MTSDNDPYWICVPVREMRLRSCLHSRQLYANVYSRLYTHGSLMGSTRHSYAFCGDPIRLQACGTCRQNSDWRPPATTAENTSVWMTASTHKRVLDHTDIVDDLISRLLATDFDLASSTGQVLV